MGPLMRKNLSFFYLMTNIETTFCAKSALVKFPEEIRGLWYLVVSHYHDIWIWPTIQKEMENAFTLFGHSKVQPLTSDNIVFEFTNHMLVAEISTEGKNCRRNYAWVQLPKQSFFGFQVHRIFLQLIDHTTRQILSP